MLAKGPSLILLLYWHCRSTRIPCLVEIIKPFVEKLMHEFFCFSPKSINGYTGFIGCDIQTFK